MTPLWRKAVRQLVRSRHQHDKTLLAAAAAARCFDATAVKDLLRESGTALAFASRREQRKMGPAFIVDIGDRACVPADSVWFECGSDWFLAEKHPVHGGHVLITDKSTLGAFGYLELEDGVATVTRVLPNGMEHDLKSPAKDAGVRALFYFLAFLAVINSPRVKASPVGTHKGADRALRAAVGRYKGEQHVTVSIDLGAARSSGPGSDGALTTSPRAYHFCRAFTRTRRGKVEHVRAHWRGDPVFGIRISSYRVRDGSA
jgi:hypothetical protein